MSFLSGAIDVAAVASLAAALVWAPRLLHSGSETVAGPRRPLAGPGWALAAVVGLIYVNQVLVTVYVIRVHAGNASFITRYLPGGWFAMATGNAFIEALARHFPAPDLLAPTVLRVQAFLELPFVLFAYLTVLRWLDRGLYRRVADSVLVWAAALSYTTVFCVVEWDLRNPDTVQDIVIRVVSAAVTPPVIIKMARREPVTASPSSAAGLLVFVVSAWAVGHVILIVYDTALLYNLAHLGGRPADGAIALAVLAAARLAARHFDNDRRVAGADPGRCVAIVADGLRWSLALFFVPALAVRYGVNFATPLIAAAAGGVIMLVAAVQTARRHDLLGGPAARPRALVIGLTAAVLAGLVTAYASVLWVHDDMYEAGLLRAAAVLLGTVILIGAIADRFLGEPQLGGVPGRPDR